jgi:hypothetical protein
MNVLLRIVAEFNNALNFSDFIIAFSITLYAKYIGMEIVK